MKGANDLGMNESRRMKLEFKGVRMVTMARFVICPLPYPTLDLTGEIQHHSNFLALVRR